MVTLRKTTSDDLGLLKSTLKEFEDDYGPDALKLMGSRVFVRHFGEMLLLCMIRGNPNSTKTESARLIQACNAIFGYTPTISGKQPDDTEALYWMADKWTTQHEAYEKDSSKNEPQSIENLAEDAAKLFVDAKYSDTASNSENLRHAELLEELTSRFPKKFYDFKRNIYDNFDRNLYEYIRLIQKLSLDEIAKILSLFSIKSDMDQFLE